MKASKRILLWALIVVLLIAAVPLWDRTAALPCMFMWRYAISYGPPGGHITAPLDGFRGFPPLCTDVIRGYSNML